MNSMDNLPDVGIISSWLADRVNNADELTALSKLLQAGFSSIDLYFLGHNEMAWYNAAAGRASNRLWRGPHAFVAGLNAREIKKIANKLQEMLTTDYSGPSIGPRPKFNSIATFFPYISLPDEEADSSQKISRKIAIEAVQKTMYLARCLGCHCVEIVGGAGVPGKDVIEKLTGSVSAEEAEHKRSQYRAERLEALADSICDIFTGPWWQKINAGSDTPYLAIELEPGQSFLLNSLQQYRDLRSLVAEKAASRGIGHIAERLLTLNVDVAHAFLIGYKPDELIDIDVSHMHLSDHGGHWHQGGSHTSDLAPDTFHRYEHFYPWLKFAIERTRSRRSFSGTIALEMEACNSVETVLNAVTVTSRWVSQCASSLPANEDHVSVSNSICKGAILTLDIGQSTSTFFGDAQLEISNPDVEAKSCMRLEATIATLCEEVHRHTGAVMSFTGDGFIAFFDSRHFETSHEAARSALNTAVECLSSLGALEEALIGRAAIDWGSVYVPRSGKLKDQIIGTAVVRTVRVCDWLSHEYEKELPPEDKGKYIATTKFFEEALNGLQNDDWEEKSITGRGITDSITILVRRSDTIQL